MMLLLRVQSSVEKGVFADLDFVLAALPGHAVDQDAREDDGLRLHGLVEIVDGRERGRNAFTRRQQRRYAGSILRGRRRTDDQLPGAHVEIIVFLFDFALVFGQRRQSFEKRREFLPDVATQMDVDTLS